MKNIKRIIALCLILCVGIATIQVNAMDTYTQQTLEIESVGGTEAFNVLSVGNQLFMEASAFGKITRYEYQEGADNVLYTLGKKLVSVSKNEGKLSLLTQNYSTKCSKPISYNGNTYIAMDELLPWLNVECSVTDNTLVVTSDAISMWELADVLLNNHEIYRFDLYKDLGETPASTVGLMSAMMFDTIVNCRFEKLIFVGDSIFDPSGNLYDRNCYRDLYLDMAVDDTLLSSTADAVIKKVFEVNKNIGTIEEALGIDEDKLSMQGDQFLLDLGVGAETMSDYATLSETWRGTRKALTSVSKASKYFNPFKILKSYETILHTTTEYRNYLKDITYDSKQRDIMQTAVREASLRLDESAGSVISYLVDLGNELLVGTLEDTYEDIIELAFKGKSLGSLFLYLDIAKIFYNTIVPVADGMSEMSKFIIYSSVGDYSWDKAYEYAEKEMTRNNVAFMCQSYMAALKSAKKAFKGMQLVFDSKAFGFSMFGDNENLMNYRIEPIDEMLVQLALTSSCRENDSIENKHIKAKEIQELLSAFILQTNDEITEFDIDQYMDVWFHTPFAEPRIEDMAGMVFTKTGVNEAEILYCDQLTKVVFISDNVAESDRFGPSNEYKTLYTFETDSLDRPTLIVEVINADTGECTERTYAYRNREDFFLNTDTENSDSDKTTEFDIDQHMGWWVRSFYDDLTSLDGMHMEKVRANTARVYYFDMWYEIVFISDNVAVDDRGGASSEYKDLYTFGTDSLGRPTLIIEEIYKDTGERTQVSYAYRNREDFSLNPETNNSDSDEITGLWSHSEYSDNYSVLIFDKKQDTATVSIEAIRGNAAQIATAHVENVRFADGVASFPVEDSFGNTADCRIEIKNGRMTITYTNEQLEEYANWGIISTPDGHYVRTKELSEVSKEWIESIKQEIAWQ